MKCRNALTRLFLATSLLLSATCGVYGYDLFGSDIAGLNVQNTDECSAACDSNADCLAWTFVRAGLHGPSARCYLKNPVPLPSYSSVCATNYDCISGLKRSDGWCGELEQGVVLSCPSGLSCRPREYSETRTLDYYCQ
jgi:PAN domain